MYVFKLSKVMQKLLSTLWEHKINKICNSSEEKNGKDQIESINYMKKETQLSYVRMI